MTTTRGRKLIPRTAAERIGFLANVLGFGQDRREILIGYELTKRGLVTIVASDPKNRAGLVPIGEGATLEEAIDRAISKNPRWKVTP